MTFFSRTAVWSEPPTARTVPRSLLADGIEGLRPMGVDGVQNLRAKRVVGRRWRGACR